MMERPGQMGSGADTDPPRQPQARRLELKLVVKESAASPEMPVANQRRTALASTPVAQFPDGLRQDLAAAGFSIRTINALVDGMGIKSIDYLRATEWRGANGKGGLAQELKSVPKIGPHAVAEVEAFHRTGTANIGMSRAAAVVTAEISPSQLSELDAWAILRGLTRPEALLLLITEGLKGRQG